MGVGEATLLAWRGPPATWNGLYAFRIIKGENKSNVNEFANIEFLNTRSSNGNAESEHVCLYLPFV